MELIAKVQNIEAHNVRAIQRDNENSEAKMFQIKSMSSEGYHELYSVTSMHFQLAFVKIAKSS